MFVAAAAFTLACAYAAGLLVFPSALLPRVIRLGVGATLVSTAVFFLLLAGWASPSVFLAAGAATLAVAAWRYRTVRYPIGGATPRLLWIPFAVYAAMYAVQAMAPEIEPDALTYHLGLTAEYARLHAFPQRIGFYEVIPQGMEMLFTAAYLLGGGSAAKLVHFAFLLATVPLIVAVGRQLAISPARSFAAALVYFAMPVAGITGTSTYNDAALVFFALATFYCLLAWHRKRGIALLLVAGLLAGFCFAIKITGAPIMAAAVIAVLLVAKRPLPALLIAAAAMIPALPWVIRAGVLTGNPFASLLNEWFPNAYFNAAAEHTLAANLRSYPGFSIKTAPWDYALRGRLQGIVGPLFFTLPFAVFALRRRAGRLLLAGALVTLSPWFLNAGTRFLMPAVPFLALALFTVLPRFAMPVLVAVQLALCWPAVLQQFEAPHAWAFREIPWRAAIGLEPEAVYLDRMTGDYAIARMIEDRTAPADRILCLTSVAKAYTTRDVVAYWYSTPDAELGEALQTALVPPIMVQSEAALSPTPITGVRLVAAQASEEEFRVFEINTAGALNASPNSTEAGLAADGNRVTSWRSRGPTERGMFLAVLFPHPISIGRFTAVTNGRIPLLLQTRGKGDAKWLTVADSLRATTLPETDLRRDATRALRQAGFRFILARAGTEGMDRVSADMVQHPDDWGLRDRGQFTPVHLFEIE